MVTIKELEYDVCKLQNQLTACQANEKIHKSNTEQQQTELKKLRDELKETMKQRDKYFNDKQLLQKEMRLVNKQLDELNISRTQLMSQIDSMMQFQSNALKLKEKMEEYTEMTAYNQQRIGQLESMKNELEKDNIRQLERNAQSVFRK